MSQTQTLDIETVDLKVQPLTPEAFAPYGDVIAPAEDGMPFGSEDAQLVLDRGTPRFYIMKLKHRPTTFKRITRHCQVTQCLASVGGADWLIAVAPPHEPDNADAEPKPEEIVAFRVPGDVAIKLHRGTWHAGPYFEAPEVGFFNLELSDTNIVDHDNCELDQRYGVAIALDAS